MSDHATNDAPSADGSDARADRPPSGRVRRLAHACVHVRDLDETLRFYRDALGLPIAFEFVERGERIGFYLRLGDDSYLEVFRGGPDAGRRSGTIDHLAFECDDLAAVVRALRAASFEASDPVMGLDHTWQAWTTDPDGVRIELQQYTSRSLQRAGGTCVLDRD